MTNPFGKPAAPGAGVDLSTINGALLIITVHSLEYQIPTVHGSSDALRCTLDVLDGPHAGDHYPDTLIFPKVLQNQLRASVGGPPVLVRLKQGTAQPGKNAPWILDVEPTPEEIKLGTAFLMRANIPAKATAAVGNDAPPF